MKFALIGAAGYIAPRHMAAIRDVGGELVAACDIHDSVGILDRYAPACRFTTAPDEFFGDLADVDMVVVCTPNDLHVSHAIQALQAGCDVLLEKPMSTRGRGAQSATVLIEQAKLHRGTIYPVVQLRYHDDIALLRKMVRSNRRIYHCEIDYATYRGPWYERSWKGHEERSGGLLLNLGVHLVDLCCYCFGPFIRATKATIEAAEARGSFRCARATVRFRLATSDSETRRVFKIAGQEIDLSNGMREFHRHVYEDAAAGHGFDLEDIAQALHAIDALKCAAG